MTDTIKKHVYVFGNQRIFGSVEPCFDSKKYTVVFISSESPTVLGTAKSVDELMDDFESYYDESQEVEAFMSFGRGSIVGNIEAIAQTFDEIKTKYKNCANAQYIGPSSSAADVFCNKYLTYKALKKLGISVPWTVEISGMSEVPKDTPFPVVLKAENLSGGRGMRYVENKEELSKAITELRSLGIDKFILNEYLSGIEATFTVLRLGDAFLRLPASYKNETTPELAHPDTKVKVSGPFIEFDQYFKHVEDVMREHSIYGFFSLQGILVKKDHDYKCMFIEAAPRLTGSTPIMVASMKNCNIFAIIAKWLSERKIEYAFESCLAIQYSSYAHNGAESVTELLKHAWIVEAKYEDLGKVAYTEHKTTRIRISFKIEDGEQLIPRLETIASICGNDTYVQEVQETLIWFKNAHTGIDIAGSTPLLAGEWGDTVKWEFHKATALPAAELCTAVFGIPKAQDGIYMTKTHRGWELPGGHIEKGESVIEALKREVFEETGVAVDRLMLYGYRKVISTEMTYSRDGEPYPFPISYIPHFLVTSDSDAADPTGLEVLGSGAFDLDSTEIRESSVREIIDLATKELNRIA